MPIIKWGHSRTKVTELKEKNLKSVNQSSVKIGSCSSSQGSSASPKPSPLNSINVKHLTEQSLINEKMLTQAHDQLNSNCYTKIKMDSNVNLLPSQVNVKQVVNNINLSSENLNLDKKNQVEYVNKQAANNDLRENSPRGPSSSLYSNAQNVQFQPRSQMNYPSQNVSFSSSTGQPTIYNPSINQAPRFKSYFHSPFVPASVYDEDPSILSEAETSATGFRRSSRARSSLPIVRTQSRAHDRSLGLVFLQYRNETKRALLPNEITSSDTVKALFVRSFPKQLTMDYLDSRNIRIYIHDQAKNMFYELEDLRDVKDRSVLRIYERDTPNGVWQPDVKFAPGLNVQSINHDNDPSYFSEPEFEGEYQTQHIHRTKKNATIALPTSNAQSQYYGTILMPSQHRPQAPVVRSFAPIRSAIQTQPIDRTRSVSDVPPVHNAPPKPQRLFQSAINTQSASKFQTAIDSRPSQSDNLVSPINPHSFQNRPLPDRPCSVAGQYPASEGQTIRNFSQGYLSSPERRLPNGENIVPGSSYASQGYGPKFEDPYGVYGTHPRSVTPIIDEEARFRVNYMEKQLASLTGLVQKALLIPAHPRPGPAGSDQKVGSSKPAPPPKPVFLTGYRGLANESSNDHYNLELFNKLKQLKNKTKDLKLDFKNLRKMAHSQIGMAKESLEDTCVKIRAMFSLINLSDPSERQLRFNRLRLSKDEEVYRLNVNRLETDLNELETQVEELRNNVINRRCRVTMSNVETMALILSRASETATDLKTRYPHLKDTLRSIMALEMDIVLREEKFIKDEPDRLESALRRCKKLTGTLVTLKRLASVQEQRNTSSIDSNTEAELSSNRSPEDNESFKNINFSNENTLDALLNELKTFSYPLNNSSSSGCDKLTKSSKGQLDATKKTASGRSNCKNENISRCKNESVTVFSRSKSVPNTSQTLETIQIKDDSNLVVSNSINSLKSVDDQALTENNKSKQQLLEERHQELLKKQKLLQEQYSRLQQLSRNEVSNVFNHLKHNESESSVDAETPSNQNLNSSTRLINNKSSKNLKSSKTNLKSKEKIKKVFETEIL